MVKGALEHHVNVAGLYGPKPVSSEAVDWPAQWGILGLVELDLENELAESFRNDPPGLNCPELSSRARSGKR